MRTIRTKVYQFSELSESAKQKAIEKNRDINTDYEWHDLTTDEQTSELIKQGYNDAKIMFSGFSSQGDGACFTCSNIDFNKFLNGKYKGLDISANITHSWRYYFATSTTVNLNDDSQNADLSDEKYNEIEQDIKDERERLGNKIYRELEEEYCSLMEDDAIIETIEANEYEFKSDGTRF
tara:strand:+ start:611 stop:1147 length:537 start_codon:yes stop_codon:yes gene_type:complete